MYVYVYIIGFSSIIIVKTYFDVQCSVNKFSLLSVMAILQSNTIKNMFTFPEMPALNTVTGKINNTNFLISTIFEIILPRFISILKKKIHCF